MGMWKCPICEREFKHQGQSHYCGDKPTTVDEYIAAQDEDKQKDLKEIRSILHSVLPEAQERISWSMFSSWQFLSHQDHVPEMINLSPGSGRGRYPPVSRSIR